jgi:hypothetical protein
MQRTPNRTDTIIINTWDRATLKEKGIYIEKSAPIKGRIILELYY